MGFMKGARTRQRMYSNASMINIELEGWRTGRGLPQGRGTTLDVESRTDASRSQGLWTCRMFTVQHLALFDGTTFQYVSQPSYLDITKRLPSEYSSANFLAFRTRNGMYKLAWNTSRSPHQQYRIKVEILKCWPSSNFHQWLFFRLLLQNVQGKEWLFNSGEKKRAASPGKGVLRADANENFWNLLLWMENVNGMQGRPKRSDTSSVLAWMKSYLSTDCTGCRQRLVEHAGPTREKQKVPINKQPINPTTRCFRVWNDNTRMFGDISRKNWKSFQCLWNGEKSYFPIRGWGVRRWSLQYRLCHLSSEVALTATAEWEAAQQNKMTSRRFVLTERPTLADWDPSWCDSFSWYKNCEETFAACCRRKRD